MYEVNNIVVTKPKLKQYFDGCIATTYGYPRVTIKLDDMSSPSLRHPCCAVRNMVMLPKQFVNIANVGIQIPYYVCTYCGRLYICPESFDV